MIRVRLFLCSESCAIDARYNAISAFHILENLTVAILPAAIPKISVVTIVDRETGDPEFIDYQLQVHLGGQLLLNNPVRIGFLGQPAARAVLEWQGMLVPTSGPLVFSLLHNDQVQATWRVLIQGPAQPALQMHFPPQQAVPPEGINR